MQALQADAIVSVQVLHPAKQAVQAFAFTKYALLQSVQRAGSTHVRQLGSLQAALATEAKTRERRKNWSRDFIEVFIVFLRFFYI